MTAVVVVILAALLLPPMAVLLFAVLGTAASSMFVEPCAVCGVDVQKSLKNQPALCQDCLYYGSGK